MSSSCKNQLLTSCFVICSSIVGLVLVPNLVGDDDREIVVEDNLQGKWVRSQQTPNGKLTIVKEHKDNRTILTAYNDQNEIIYGHQSEFKVGQSGKVRIFTFFNREIVAGPNAGKIIKEPVSFVYRVDKERFVEAYGLLEDDPMQPNMIVWKRQNASDE